MSIGKKEDWECWKTVVKDLSLLLLFHRQPWNYAVISRMKKKQQLFYTFPLSDLFFSSLSHTHTGNGGENYLNSRSTNHSSKIVNVIPCNVSLCEWEDFVVCERTHLQYYWIQHSIEKKRKICKKKKKKTPSECRMWKCTLSIDNRTGFYLYACKMQDFLTGLKPKVLAVRKGNRITGDYVPYKCSCLSRFPVEMRRME